MAPMRQESAVTVPICVPDPSCILDICAAVIDDYVGDRLDASMVQCPCQALQLLLVAVAGAQVVQLTGQISLQHCMECYSNK